MKRMLMAEQWEQFARKAFNADTPAVQRSEMRRAFYAGAQILFRVIQSFAPETEPTDADLQVMTDLNDELNDFELESLINELGKTGYEVDRVVEKKKAKGRA